MFPSVSLPGLSGSRREWSRAVTCLQPGMLTDMRAGSHAGLSCPGWPIITYQVRLSVLLKPNQRPEWRQIVAPQAAEDRICWLFDNPDKQIPYRRLYEADRTIISGRKTPFISFLFILAMSEGNIEAPLSIFLEFNKQMSFIDSPVRIIWKYLEQVWLSFTEVLL